MTDDDYSLVVSILTLGLLGGALMASPCYTWMGYKKVGYLIAVIFGMATVLMATGITVRDLLLGRVLAGFASGLAIVLSPLWLIEMSPSENENSVVRSIYASSTQFGIVMGIFIGVILGAVWSDVGVWRRILWFPVLFSIAHVVFLVFAHIPQPGRSKVPTSEPILGNEDPESAPPNPFSDDSSAYPIPPTPSPLLCPATLRAFIIMGLLQLGQQFTGINAVMFYSTPILSSVLPVTVSAYVSVLIAFVNMLATVFVPHMLRGLGLKNALVVSGVWAGVAVWILGIGLAFSWSIVAAIGVLVFVAGFAVGLGPVPFLVAPGLVSHAPSLAPQVQSVGIMVNSVANFVIGVGFLGWRERIGEWVWGGFGVACFAVAMLAMVGLKHEGRH